MNTFAWTVTMDSFAWRFSVCFVAEFFVHFSSGAFSVEFSAREISLGTFVGAFGTLCPGAFYFALFCSKDVHELSRRGFFLGVFCRGILRNIFCRASTAWSLAGFLQWALSWRQIP